MMLTFLFGLTTFLSAFLMFWLELFFAKLLLPQFGGGAAIWTTCLACFQLLLLLGYLYAHWLKSMSPIRQKIIHLGAIALALPLLPVRLMDWQGLPQHPVLQIFVTLMGAIGLPMMLLATTSLLLQSWLARRNDNPYFLYGLSNVGSLAALVLYPLLIEPRLPLSQQSILWSILFMLVMACMGTCLLRAPQPDLRSTVPAVLLTGQQRWLWMAYAFIPSSLLAGITTYTTSDIAPSPLVWSIFLGLYLLTLILVFCPTPLYPPQDLGNVIVFFAIAFILLEAHQPSRVSNDFLTLNIVMFTGVAWIFHARLVQSKPPSSQLTEFYLFQALGGTLGGLFNSILAPILFSRLIEYHVMLAIALPTLLYLPKWWRSSTMRFLVWLRQQQWLAYIICSAMILVLIQSPAGWGMSLERSVRSFYGAYQVGKTEVSRLLLHGVTIHGQQYIEPAHQRIPGSYYAKGSPISQVFDHTSSNAKVGVVGLGAGEISSYSQPHQAWTFYEIDPLMVDIAQHNFSYLAQMPHPASIVVGDGRLKLATSQEVYDTLILDAFSSDAIPLHLLTLDALNQVFLPHLSKKGTIAYHITNQYIDLEAPLGALAKATGLTGLIRHDHKKNPNSLPYGTSTDWVVLTRDPEMARLLQSDDWQAIQQNAIVWRDDFTNLYSALKHRQHR
jgi:hypothetical protein